MSGDPVSEAVTISDCDGREFLKIQWHDSDELKVTLQFGSLSASLTSPYFYSGKSLDEFFAELSKQWRGWEGVQSWAAYALEIRAAHNGRSRVALTCHLRWITDPNDWQASATLDVEPGELDSIAAEMRDFLNPGLKTG